MTQEIVQVTDFSLIEDAIESWVVLGSGIPLNQDDDGVDLPQAHWSGFYLDRKRPYVLISSLAMPTEGQPWTSKEMVTEEVEKRVTKYFQPFKWSISFTFFEDSYNSDGTEIRQQAKFYAQQLVNRAYLEPVKSILDALKISFDPLNQTPIPGIQVNQDDDKYIHQATIDYMFEGIAQTALKDTEFFTSIAEPTYNIEE